MGNKKYIVFPLLLCIICLAIFCKPEKAVLNSEPTPKFLNLHDTTQYVGMTTCKSCHANVHNTFIETGMGRSFDLASREKSDARFDHNALVYDQKSDFYYKPYFKNDKMYVHEFRLNNGDTVHSRTEQIDYIIGSGQHTNSHIIEENGFIYQAPVTYYTQEEKWDMAPGFENKNLRFSRALSAECITCHNHLPKAVEGAFNKYTEMPTGIECERCHGPGSIHVKEKLSGNIIDTSKYIDYSIVNPRHLDRNLQMDLCQRCHLQGIAVLNEGKTFFDFKPGMELKEVANVFLPRYTDSHEKFIMASQADRLRMSACFTETETLTCISCHNPHHSVVSKKVDTFNSVCSSCHSAEADVKCSEGISLRNAKGDNCVTCHMPKSGSIDIPHVNITDHYISKKNTLKSKEVSEKKQSEIAEFLGLQILTKQKASSLEMANAYIALFDRYTPAPQLLDSAKFYLDQVSIESAQKRKALIHYYFSKKEMNGILSLTENLIPEEVNDHWTLYRIAEANFQNQNYKRALPFITKAVELMPYDLDFLEKKATCLMYLKRAKKAKETFQLVLSENAKRKISLCNLGFLYVSENNFLQGVEFYKKALALDPDYEQALLNLAAVYLYQNKRQEAVPLLQRLLKINPNNQEATDLLNS